MEIPTLTLSSLIQDSGSETLQVTKSADEQEEKTINVCLVSPNFDIADFDTEATVDCNAFQLYPIGCQSRPATFISACHFSCHPKSL